MMNTQPTLAAHQTGPHQTDIAHYRAILADIDTWLNSLSAPLQAMARPSFDALAQGEFSQVAALLPYWLSDLLPVPDDTSHRLGLAQLYFWWYYAIQDELLDARADPAGLVIAHLALLQTVNIFNDLDVTRAPAWADFRRLTQVCAEATALEVQVRFTSLAELTPARVAHYTLDFVTDRLAAFFFTFLAQLDLAAIPPPTPAAATCPPRCAVLPPLVNWATTPAIGPPICRRVN